jgi:anti-sigma regulatory factor (Ser/Thr protein kinase)
MTSESRPIHRIAAAPDKDGGIPLSQTRTFPRTKSSVRAAREFAAKAVSDWGRTDRIDDIRLCVSEVTTNALVHGVPPGRMFAVRVEAGEDQVRVEIRDSGDRTPVLRMPGLEDENGRGLHLVDELADDWGVTPLTVGKTVWIVFKISPVAPGGTR